MSGDIGVQDRPEVFEPAVLQVAEDRYLGEGTNRVRWGHSAFMPLTGRFKNFTNIAKATNNAPYVLDYTEYSQDNR